MLLDSYAGQIKKDTDDSKKIHEDGENLVKKAENLEGKATFVELGEIALQISVVLCSITILTEQKLFVRMGMTVAFIGLLLALRGLFVQI
jgi:hypothetical protein